jgi:hypothetical protein
VGINSEGHARQKAKQYSLPTEQQILKGRKVSRMRARPIALITTATYGNFP